MGDAADTQGGSADASPAPAHDAANTAPSPPEGGKAETTTNPAETNPETPKESDKKSTADDTVATAAADDDQEAAGGGGSGSKPVAIVAASKKERPPYKFNPDKITLRFLFANRDGLTVTVECNPSDTVGEVKGALLSVWPDDLPDCEGGELLRLVCMGKGFLMPDTRTLEDCQIPVFKTHPTPINVAVKPGAGGGKSSSKEPASKSGGGASNDADASAGVGAEAQQANQGCACIIL